VRSTLPFVYTARRVFPGQVHTAPRVVILRPFTVYLLMLHERVCASALVIRFEPHSRSRCGAAVPRLPQHEVIWSVSPTYSPPSQFPHLPSRASLNSSRVGPYLAQLRGQRTDLSTTYNTGASQASLSVQQFSHTAVGCPQN